jgi:predicted Fe-Mo cluster-binding NifX family protein
MWNSNDKKEVNEMRLGIPVMDKNGYESIIGQHFGRVPYFAIVDMEKKDISFIDNTSEHFGGVGAPPELLRSNNVEIMLCSGLGPKAIHLFESYGIEIFVGASGTVRNAIEQWKGGNLREATDANACKEHRH